MDLKFEFAVPPYDWWAASADGRADGEHLGSKEESH
jgi:hypothetical protein